MSLRFPAILPSYAYADPATFVGLAVPIAARRIEITVASSPKRKRIWDEHYRRARRLHVKQLMRGRA